MRSEGEILDLIVSMAKQDERVRAVIMNGSRANPESPRDCFQDFDVVYVVTDVRSFKDDREWINRFGETMIIQIPEEMQDPPPTADAGFAYLMQFADGNRIDLGIYPVERLGERIQDSLTVLLLDKDGIVSDLPLPSDKDYLPQPPGAKPYADCCNEFWWVCPYAAKGLWRGHIVYAKSMLEGTLRPQLMRMLVWHVGVKTGFSVNPGYQGKYLQQHLEPNEWKLLLSTYADADVQNTWDSLFNMCNLFRSLAVSIADEYGFVYPTDEDRKVIAHLQHVRDLPEDASEIY